MPGPKKKTWRTKDISHNESLMHSQAGFNAVSNYVDMPIYWTVLISSKHLLLYEAVIYLLAGCSGHKSRAKTRSSFTELSADRLRSINQEYYSQPHPMPPTVSKKTTGHSRPWQAYVHTKHTRAASSPSSSSSSSYLVKQNLRCLASIVAST